MGKLVVEQKLVDGILVTMVLLLLLQAFFTLLYFLELTK